MSRTLRTIEYALSICVVLTAALGATAQTRTETLRWSHPDPSEVVSYRVHYGPTSRSYDHFVDLPTPSAEGGVFAYDLEVDAASDVWVAVTALNEDFESFFSNESCRGPDGECAAEPPPDPPDDPPPAPGEPRAAVIGFVLWDAATDTRIDANFESGEQISLAEHPCVAIEILGNGYLSASGPGSIMKAFDAPAPAACDNPGVTHEDTAPFAWEVEAGPGRFECAPTLTQPGPHFLTLIPFDGDGCTGLQGASTTLTFEVVGSAPPDEPPPPDEPEPLGQPGQPQLILN